MIRLNTKLVQQSAYTRRLQTIAVLEKYLDQVKDYKAMHKVHELFYNKADKGINPNYFELRKTDWSFSVYERYGNVEVHFYDLEHDKSKDNALEFRISDKSIPAVIQGLKEYKDKLVLWREEENQMSVSEYRFEDIIEKHFDKEMTPRQFKEMKRELSVYLTALAVEVMTLEVSKERTKND